MNALSQSHSKESICLRAFILVLQERSLDIHCYADLKDEISQEEARAAEKACHEARKGGIIFPCYIDLMAKIIQGMGYTGDEGHRLLTFFRNNMPSGD